MSASTTATATASAEANDQKVIPGPRRRYARSPGGSFLAGIRGHGVLQQRPAVKGGTERDRFIGSVWYEHRHFNAGFDYLTGVDQTLPTTAKVDVDGYSFFLTPFFKEKGERPRGAAALRLVPAKRGRRVRAGTASSPASPYWFPHPGGNATAALLLDYEQVTFARFTTAQAKQQRIVLHGLINF